MKPQKFENKLPREHRNTPWVEEDDDDSAYLWSIYLLLIGGMLGSALWLLW